MADRPQTLYLIAGESSGDAHAASLMRELRELAPALRFCGAGGPQMRAVGGPAIFEWTQEAVVGLWDVLLKYPYFRAQFYRMYREIAALAPAAVVFVDYPGFNLRLARLLRRKLFTGKLIYYISPQVWAWNRGRIPHMAQFLDLMLCIFPFERALYQESGLRTHFVGHPMLVDLARRRLTMKREANLVALLPGSREREVKKIFPVMLQAARLLLKTRPGLCFAASSASERLLPAMKSLAQQHGFPDLPVQLRDATELMQRAQAGMIASGTATMEASFFGLPFVLLYKVAPLTYWIGRRLIRVNYLGMPNILANRPLIPEFIQQDARPEQVAAAVDRLLGDELARAAMIDGMQEVIRRIGAENADVRAAAAVLSELNSNSPAKPA